VLADGEVRSRRAVNRDRLQAIGISAVAHSHCRPIAATWHDQPDAAPIDAGVIEANPPGFVSLSTTLRIPIHAGQLGSWRCDVLPQHSQGGNGRTHPVILADGDADAATDGSRSRRYIGRFVARTPRPAGPSSGHRFATVRRAAARPSPGTPARARSSACSPFLRRHRIDDRYTDWTLGTAFRSGMIDAL
jgi:hypothetical protein